MADKKISELPIVYNITASGVGLYPQNVVPVVVAGTTWQMSVQNFSKYATQYSATTGSNIFLGNQNITGDVNIVGNQTISGTLTVNTVVAQYETASVLFSSGSNKFGDQSTDKHEFTGSAYFADSIYINGNSIGAGALNQVTASLQAATASIQNFTASVNATLSRVWQTTSSLQDTTASINNYTASVNDTLSRVWQTTSSLQSTTASINNYTASVNATLSRVWQTTASLQSTSASVNTYTASVNDTLSRVWQTTSSLQSTTASINTYTASVNDTLSRVWQTTASLQSTSASVNTYTASVNDTLSRIWQTTASLQAATSSANADLGRVFQSTASLQSATASLQTYTASVNDTLSRVWQTTASLNIFTGSQDSRNFVISQFTSSTNNSIVGVSAFTSSQLAVNLQNSIITSSYRIELNTIEAYTASLKNAISVSGTNVQIIGDLNVNKLNVNYVSSSVLVTSGSNIFGDQSTDKHEFTGSVYLQNSLLLGTEVLGNAGLNSFTASTNNSIVGVSAFTSSQLAVNLGNSIFTSSARIELNSIEAYTSSLKAAAIVSSSTQITNYFKFAETASANTFYGNQTFNSDVRANKFVFTDGVINTNVGGQYVIATSGNVTYLYTGTSGLNINDATNGNINVSISNVGAVQTRGKLTVGAPGNDQDIAFGGSNAKLDWAGTGAQIFYSVGALQFSSVGTTNNMILQQQAGALFNAGITGSLMATNGVVSSSQQIQNYNKFALTASANTFYGNQTITGSLNVGVGTSDNTVGDLLVDVTNKTVYVGRQSSTSGDNTIFAVRNRLNSLNAIYADPGGNGAVNITGSFEVTRGVKLGTATGDVTVSTGNLVIGTAGKGIDFSINTGGAGKSSQLLSDYEEGIHTATITPSTSGTVTLNSGYDSLSYVKIGSVVHVSGLLSVSSVSSPVGSFRISLPFQCANLADAAGTAAASVVVNGTVATNVADFVGWVDELTSYVVVYRADGTSVAATAAAQLQANSDIYVQITYRTS